MRIFYLSLGFIFLAVGVAGIILPLLPGTVNLLIAAFFFAKGSPRMEAWMLQHPHLGPPIRNWRADRSMTRKTKIIAISMMWAGICFSVLKAPWYAGAISVGLGVWGTLYIVTRPTRLQALPAAPATDSVDAA